MQQGRHVMEHTLKPGGMPGGAAGRDGRAPAGLGGGDGLLLPWLAWARTMDGHARDRLHTCATIPWRAMCCTIRLCIMAVSLSWGGQKQNDAVGQSASYEFREPQQWQQCSLPVAPSLISYLPCAWCPTLHVALHLSPPRAVDWLANLNQSCAPHTPTSPLHCAYCR